MFAANIVVANDRLDFTAFNSSLSFNATVVEHNATGDIDVTNKIVMVATADSTVAETNTTTKVAALFQGIGDALHISSGGKAVVIGGDNSAATAGAIIAFVDDSVGANVGTIEADDVSYVGTTTLDIDTLTAGNFV